jgi:hypothetical protein
MWFLEYDVYTGFKRLKEHFRAKFIEHFWEDNQARHKSRLKVNMTPKAQGRLEIWRFTCKINTTREIFAQPRTTSMQIWGLKRPLMEKCWLPKLWTMLRALIWTYGNPNSVQGARRYGPRNTCCADKPEIRQIILRGHFGDLRKPMNTKVEDNFIPHNLDTEFALFIVWKWEIWHRQGRAAKQKNLGEANFMETKFASLSRKILCNAR